MNIAQPGIDLLKQYEGIVMKDGKCVPYICPTGHPTIGWGCTENLLGETVTMNETPITVDQAEVLLRKMLTRFIAAVNKLVKVPLTQNQFDALVCFTYNLGEANLASSTLLKKLNAGDYEGAAREFPRWNRGNVKGQMVEIAGLTRRRLAEQALFVKKV